MQLELIKVITDVGMQGVVVWVLWYVFTRMIPRMMLANRTEIALERKLFADELAKLRADGVLDRESIGELCKSVNVLAANCADHVSRHRHKSAS